MNSTETGLKERIEDLLLLVGDCRYVLENYRSNSLGESNQDVVDILTEIEKHTATESI
jgi:hypothetical protein